MVIPCEIVDLYTIKRHVTMKHAPERRACLAVQQGVVLDYGNHTV